MYIRVYPEKSPRERRLMKFNSNLEFLKGRKKYTSEFFIFFFFAFRVLMDVHEIMFSIKVYRAFRDPNNE